MKNFIIIAAFSVTTILVDGCARNPVTGKKQVVFMSEEQEIATGKQADPEIVAAYGLYPDSSLQRFITEKGRQMAAISHRPNLAYEFKIVDSDILNAFATPGGYVYFTRGIMAHFNNEAEFAGVLGHEIGHITARHSVIQQRNAMLGQIGLLATIVIKPQLARFAESASQGLGLLFLKFGRDAEREADKLGVEYSSKINYDANQMAGFFKTLERQSAESGAGELPPFLSTHPNPGDRNVAVAELTKQVQQQLKLTNPQVNRNNYLRRIEGLVYGEDPRQGFVENNIFYHPELKFQFPTPQDWAFQNTPQRVQMAPKDGRALMMMMLAPGKSLQEAASAVLQQFSLKALESRNITVNGLNAITMVADQVAQQQQQQAQEQQQTVRTLSYIIEYNKAYYLLIGVTDANDFASFTPAFSNTMQNFRVLTDAAKINRKPERIRLKTITQAATLADILRTYKTPEKRLEELAIVNGMQLTDKVAQGTMVKVLGQ